MSESSFAALALRSSRDCPSDGALEASREDAAAERRLARRRACKDKPARHSQRRETLRWGLPHTHTHTHTYIHSAALRSVPAQQLPVGCVTSPPRAGNSPPYSSLAAQVPSCLPPTLRALLLPFAPLDARRGACARRAAGREQNHANHATTCQPHSRFFAPPHRTRSARKAARDRAMALNSAASAPCARRGAAPVRTARARAPTPASGWGTFEAAWAVNRVPPPLSRRATRAGAPRWHLSPSLHQRNTLSGPCRHPRAPPDAIPAARACFLLCPPPRAPRTLPRCVSAGRRRRAPPQAEEALLLHPSAAIVRATPRAARRALQERVDVDSLAALF